jgi:hypothetical protein
MAGRSAHVELSIDVGSEPISGLVVVGANQPQSFSGWMELVAAIEAVRDQDEPVGGVGGCRPLGGAGA